MNRAGLAVCTVPGVLSAIASDICYLLKTSGFTIHPAEEERLQAQGRQRSRGRHWLTPQKETFLYNLQLGVYIFHFQDWLMSCLRRCHKKRKKKIFSRW